MRSKPCSIIRNVDPAASYEAAINERSDNVKRSSSGRSKRSVALHSHFWEPGRTLKIAMYDANQETINKVKSIASQWTEHANLKFEFVSGAVGDIRIKIAPSDTGVSISQLGTDALIHPPEEPTMTIGLALEHAEFEGTILHEFGHVLGLHHEHQHPDADIPWDLEKVYAFYKDLYNFERDRVDSDVLPLPRYSNVTYGDYDPLSIMHYNIDSRLTLNNLSHPGNLKLSEKDKAVARKIYPQNTTFLPDILFNLINKIKSPFTGSSN